MEIKGHLFGAGKPVVCVPVVERTEADILSVIGQMAEQRMEMIEWRMDWYEGIHERTAVEGLLAQIKPLVEKMVFLCTFRSRSQGGEAAMELEEYLALNRLVAENGVADLVDLEFYELLDRGADSQMPHREIHRLQQAGVRVICSDHDFQGTPAIQELARKLAEPLEAGADFAKLAVMPGQKRDVLHLMEAVLEVKETHPDSHLIAMSMGKEGVVSRLLGEWYFSEVTFAAFGKASAPGQISHRMAEHILEQIEECIGGK